MARVRYTQIESPVGRLLLAMDEAGLRHIRFLEARQGARPEPAWTRDRTPFSALIRELRAYFHGELERFDQPLAPEGTSFQLTVWTELSAIPYGETISYQELAHRVGNPHASRAVGMANGANPIPIVIPCHRVIGSDGKLTGYGGGLAIKQKLLALERGQLRLL
ncbi:MAG TPA: methylated-DNA--[protein]-cysteine S-methyltransferase [Terriglobales bacterium]|nr:methylated-DNA--[protein]-cysteine S-methyltransferase [Terriglobales bacterium]